MKKTVRKMEQARSWLLKHPGRYTISYLCRELRFSRSVVYRALCSLRDLGAAEKWGEGRTTMWKVYSLEMDMERN